MEQIGSLVSCFYVVDINIDIVTLHGRYTVLVPGPSALSLRRVMMVYLQCRRMVHDVLVSMPQANGDEKPSRRWLTVELYRRSRNRPEDQITRSRRVPPGVFHEEDNI